MHHDLGISDGEAHGDMPRVARSGDKAADLALDVACVPVYELALEGEPSRSILSIGQVKGEN